MIRKVIPQRDSFTITLPKNWAKSQSIKGGDEITIKGLENSLIIDSIKKTQPKKIELDVTNMSDIFIRNLLNSLYTLSLTQITLHSTKPKKLILCKKLCSLFLVGFEVITEKENKITLEALAVPSEENFEKFFSKILQIVDSDFEILEEEPENFEEVKRGTKRLTQYSNVCRRILLASLSSSKSKAILLETVNLLREVNHLIFHLSKNNKKLPKKDIVSLKEKFSRIRKAYTKGDISLIDKTQKELEKILNNSQESPYVFAISRNLYNLSNSIINLLSS